VEAGGDGNAEAARGAQRRPAERALRGDVQRVRARCRPRGEQLAGRGQARAQAGIARQRQAADQGFAGPRRGRGDLSWPHQRDLVPPFAQAAFQRLHGQRDAVDLGRVGFGDDGVAHARLHVSRMLADAHETRVAAR